VHGPNRDRVRRTNAASDALKEQEQGAHRQYQEQQIQAGERNSRHRRMIALGRNKLKFFLRLAGQRHLSK